MNTGHPSVTPLTHNNYQTNMKRKYNKPCKLFGSYLGAGWEQVDCHSMASNLLPTRIQPADKQY